ncbi:hypothetical protein AGDE_08025 [Angomonas deanei]|nr:hypothetical protein AGDE_08025 [Angomonas deanei]|eukprot:EPY34067.1 hypothetical protein AGDE_08025 [Angomonas deanei]
MNEVNSFDITKTRPFNLLAYIVALLILILWKTYRSSPNGVQRVVQKVQSGTEQLKINDACQRLLEFAQNCLTKVPVVGERTVDVIEAFSSSVKEQVKDGAQPSKTKTD